MTALIAIILLCVAAGIGASFYPGRTVDDNNVDNLPGLQAEFDREAREYQEAVSFSTEVERNNRWG